MEKEHRRLDTASSENKGTENNDTHRGNAAFLRDLKNFFEGEQCKGTCSDLIVKAREIKSSNGTLKSEGYDLQLSDTEEMKRAFCCRRFFVTLDGKYVTQEQCIYLWGKLEKAVAPQPNKVGAVRTSRDYSCCRGNASARGCTTGKLHVWNGVGPGLNGPLDGYVQTRVRKSFPPDGNFGIYGLECEMCYTAHGMELVRMTVVTSDGHRMYGSLVRPESHIILVGDGLENDRFLRIIHSDLIDTYVIFPHSNSLLYCCSLKSLISWRDISSRIHLDIAVLMMQGLAWN
jgi:RNA exonuclease 1